MATDSLRAHPEWPAQPDVTVGCDDRNCTVCYISETFVLERTENPHPRMLAEAVKARSEGRLHPAGTEGAYWHGFLAAMCAATGETPEALEAWMDRLSQ